MMIYKEEKSLQMKSVKLSKSLITAILLISTSSLIGASCKPNEDRVVVHKFIMHGKYPCGMYVYEGNKLKHFVSCEQADKENWFSVDEDGMRAILEYKLACDKVLNP